MSEKEGLGTNIVVLLLQRNQRTIVASCEGQEHRLHMTSAAVDFGLDSLGSFNLIASVIDQFYTPENGCRI
jgi:hypothetical protein